jgi:hypothetical protein
MACRPRHGSRPLQPQVGTVTETAKMRRTDAAALLVLAGLTLIFFWKIALTNRVLAGLDVFAYFYPYRDFASAALRSGQLPLWDPYLFMGAPFLANSQAAVLYPLHWPLLWLSVPKQIAWSIVLHLWLAGAGTYLFARRAIGLRSLAALVAATVCALGGFLGAQVEHVNQLNASAWLPWLLLCLDAARRKQGRRRWLALLGGGAVVALTLLAGHTQAAYIVLVGAGVYAGLAGLQHLKKPEWRQGLRTVALLVVMGSMGVALALGQLLPTWELSRLSVRSEGLPYQEAASFSLKPGLIVKAFLPPLLWDPPLSEYVAYVGLIGLALAAGGAWAAWRRRRPGGAMLVLALLGVFLAFGAYNPVYYVLYRLIPGFELFRAPARWLLLYNFGAAVLAGIGLEALPRLRVGQYAITFLLVVELFIAGRRLAYNRPTAPPAFDSLRTAPVHLLADAESEPFRFLSLSDILYDPGDLGDFQAMYGPYLSEQAIYELIVATKMKEVLAYNLPLRYRLFSVDGYDGGLLPIDRYVTLERLFLAEEDIWPDGRLRQQLRAIPPNRLLSLLNVKYVITDKMQDVWIDDVFYDLEHTTPLGQVTLTDLPDFEATHLGVVSYLTGTADLADGTPVARVSITSTTGTVVTATLRAGVDTTEGLYGAEPVAHRQATVGHPWREQEQGSDYVTVLDLGQPLRPAHIEVCSLLFGEHFQLRGLSLIDQRTGTSRTVSVDPAYRLVHSGDVKIYQNLKALPRAFVVHQKHGVADDEEALAVMREPSFDPAVTVLVAGETGGESVPREGDSTVEIVSYEPERVRVQVSVNHDGWLVLTDAFYPGWFAQVDGQSTPMERADLYFRAVALEPGEHTVVFRYRPAGLYVGLALGLTGWLLWGIALAALAHHIGRRKASSV